MTRTALLAFGMLVPLLLAPALTRAAANAADTGSTNGCAALAQAGAAGAAATLAADNQTIQPPQSVTQLSCLGNFFNGVGLNVITNFLNPGNLLQSVEGQICNAANTAYQSALGSAQCGITLSGFNMGGLGNLGFGNFCPSLHFGGSGPTVFGVGTNTNTAGATGLYVDGNPMTPTGYPTATANGP